MQLAFEVPAPVVVLGILTGLVYGLIAVGLVLVYRVNRVINFAHGQIGAFGATVFGLAVVRWGVPYWVAFLPAVVLSGAAGALTEVAVVRRLRRAPAVVTLVATLGVAQVLLLVSFAINSQVANSRVFPQPSGLPEFDLGALRVTRAYSGMLFIAPVVMGALALFLRYHRAGINIRAAASNPDAARTSGVYVGRMSALTWALAGMVSGITAILIFPTRGFVTGESLGPSLLLRALVAAVVARMTSLPIALVAGIAVGIVEQMLLWNYPSGGQVEAILLGIVLVALLLQRVPLGRLANRENWIAVQPWPAAAAQSPKVRQLARIAGGVGFLTALILGLTVTNGTAVSLVSILSFATVGLSLAVITGLAGQLSLGQFAIAGVGAAISAIVTANTGNYFLAFAASGVVAAGVSVLLGLPALRVRGMMLAVATLSFALAAQTWLLRQPWLLGEGRDPGRPIIGGNALNTGGEYFLFALIPFGIALWIAANVWRGGVGRLLRALRDNEAAARAFAIPATRLKLQAFGLAGLLAGIGGSIYGHSLSRLTASSFPVAASINVVALTALGGIGVLVGPVLGALYIIGVPTFLPLDSAGLAATALGWLLVLMYYPGGVAEMLAPVRLRLLAWLVPDSPEDGLTDIAESELGRKAVQLSGERAAPVVPSTVPVLRATGLVKRYGGLTAVNGLSLEVQQGETLGLIGPNGAGKTTAFELLSGFTKVDAGHIQLFGQDVTTLGAEERAGRGLIRSFQDAALFPTLTVEECVSLALERTAPTSFARSVVGLQAAERRTLTRALEFIELMGLGRYRHTRIVELSTGTRRMVDLACVLALEPSVLLLDEPSAGIAQRESESLGEVIEGVKRQLGATLILIEHDIPLVMGLSDRVIVMASGEIIAEGPPAAVQSNAAVIDAYLGGPVSTSEKAAGQCQAHTRSGAQCSRRQVDGGFCSQHGALVTAQ